jgi:hypothetical protein
MLINCISICSITEVRKQRIYATVTSSKSLEIYLKCRETRPKAEVYVSASPIYEYMLYIRSGQNNCGILRPASHSSQISYAVRPWRGSEDGHEDGRKGRMWESRMECGRTERMDRGNLI